MIDYQLAAAADASSTRISPVRSTAGSSTTDQPLCRGYAQQCLSLLQLMSHAACESQSLLSSVLNIVFTVPPG
jgi:hypothetical protein